MKAWLLGPIGSREQGSTGFTDFIGGAFDAGAKGQGQGPRPRAKAKGQGQGPRPRARAKGQGQGQGQGPRPRAKAKGQGQGPRPRPRPRAKAKGQGQGPPTRSHSGWKPLVSRTPARSQIIYSAASTRCEAKSSIPMYPQDAQPCCHLPLEPLQQRGTDSAAQD